MKVAAQILAHALESMERHGVCKQVRSLVAFDVGHAAGISDWLVRDLVDDTLRMFVELPSVKQRHGLTANDVGQNTIDGDGFTGNGRHGVVTVPHGIREAGLQDARQHDLVRQAGSRHLHNSTAHGGASRGRG